MFALLVLQAWLAKLWERSFWGEEVCTGFPELWSSAVDIWDKWGLQSSSGLALYTLSAGVRSLLVKEEVCFSDMYIGILWPEPHNLKCGLWTRSISIWGSLLEMRSPRPHPSPPESEPAFQHDPQVIPTSTLPFENQGPRGDPRDVLRVESEDSLAPCYLQGSESVLIPLCKPAPGHPGPLRAFQSLHDSPVKGVTQNHPGMKVGFAWSSGHCLSGEPPSAKLLLPQILTSGPLKGFFQEAVFYSAGRVCPCLPRKAWAVREAPRSEPTV